MAQNQLQEMKKVFENLSENEKIEDFYYDFNFFENSNFHIEVDKENTSIDKSFDKGVKLRVFDNEKFLEFGTTNLNQNFLEKNLDKLVIKAKNNQDSIEEKVELNYEKIELDKHFCFDDFKNNFTLEEKVEKVKNIRDKILGHSEDIVNARVVLIEEVENHCFKNKYKSLTQSISTNIIVGVVFVKSEDGEMKYVYDAYCNNDFDIFEKFENNLDKLFEKVENVKVAKKLEGGRYKVILAPKLTGLLAHESFGHGMEADTMYKDRALASKWQGEKIGSENVSIIDYAQMVGKNGTYFFDHEGNLAKKTYLVENGVINEPLSDNYSKTRLNLNNSCNSRFESFDHKNYVRMSNTYFEAGHDDLDDMIGDVEDGIFVTDANGGMEDPKNWGVQIQGCFGQRIKNGKLVEEYFEGFSFTGFLPDIVKNISKISKEVEIDGAGTCGKGHKEWVRVADGGPYLLINEVILG